MNQFQNLFQTIKNSEESGFIKEIKYSKPLKDEYIILNLKNGNQD